MPPEAAILFMLLIFSTPLALTWMILHYRAKQLVSSEELKRIEARLEEIDHKLDERMADVMLMLDEAVQHRLPTRKGKDEDE